MFRFPGNKSQLEITIVNHSEQEFCLIGKEWKIDDDGVIRVKAHIAISDEQLCPEDDPEPFDFPSGSGQMV